MLDLLKIAYGSRGMLSPCESATAPFSRETEEPEKITKEEIDFRTASHFVVSEFGLLGQEACAALWRRGTCAEPLVVHLITVALCLSED